MWGEDFVPIIAALIAVSIFAAGFLSGWLTHRLKDEMRPAQTPAEPVEAEAGPTGIGWIDDTAARVERHIGRGVIPGGGRHSVEDMQTRDLLPRLNGVRMRPAVPDQD